MFEKMSDPEKKTPIGRILFTQVSRVILTSLRSGSKFVNLAKTRVPIVETVK